MKHSRVDSQPGMRPVRPQGLVPVLLPREAAAAGPRTSLREDDRCPDEVQTVDRTQTGLRDTEGMGDLQSGQLGVQKGHGWTRVKTSPCNVPDENSPEGWQTSTLSCKSPSRLHWRKRERSRTSPCSC